MAENASAAQGGGESPPIKPDTKPKRTGRKRKRKRRGSVMYRTWLYFIAMTVAMLSLLWVTEMILFKAYYARTKEREIIKECSELFDDFSADKYDETTGEVDDA